jgi:RND family efflux transporter MFP subunit
MNSRRQLQRLARRSFLAVGICTACAVQAAEDSSGALASAEARYVTVAVERVFDGTVEAVHQGTVSAQTAGRIAEAAYDVDDYVESGAVLFRFTDVEQRTALRQAEAQLAEARARRTEAGEEYRRAENMRERGLGSQRDLDRARAERESAMARVEVAESAVEAAQQKLEYTVVRAPYAGIVTKRHVEVGEAVTPGQPLMSGLSLERLRVAVDIPQSVASEIRDEPRAVLITGEGRVQASGITLFPIADPVTNTFRVRLELPDGQFGLYPGMFVKAAFAVGETERLLVPAAAVFHRSEVTGVYVVRPDGVRLRQVRTGPTIGDQVEILAGLSAGEQVALDPVRAGIAAKSALDDGRD